MTKRKDPEYDPEKVIARLISEQSRTGRILADIQQAIDSDKEFQGLTLAGGIRTIIRRYKEEQEKNLKLKKEISSLMASRSSNNK